MRSCWHNAPSVRAMDPIVEGCKNKAEYEIVSPKWTRSLYQIMIFNFVSIKGSFRPFLFKTLTIFQLYKQWPQNTGIGGKLCIYSYMFKLQVTFKTLPIWCNTPVEMFFPLLSSWAHWFWYLLVLLLFFVSPLPHRQNISLWGLFFFHPGKQKKVTRGKIVQIGSKTAECAVWCGQVHP